MWNDDAVKNMHYILGDKPWNDGGKGLSRDETHIWWWEVDEERKRKEKEAGLAELE
jgi:hypothetical protein